MNESDVATTSPFRYAHVAHLLSVHICSRIKALISFVIMDADMKFSGQAAVFLLVIMVATSTIPLPLILLIPWLAVLAYLCFQYLMECGIFWKRIVLDVYLLPTSQWRGYFYGTEVTTALAIPTAIALSFATYVSLYAESLFAVVTVVLMIALADWITRFLYPVIDQNFVDAYAKIFRRSVSGISAFILVFAGLYTVRLCESLLADYGNETAYSSATRTIEEVKHPVIHVRHWVRTIRYYDLTLLRIRDTLGGPMGWTLYLAILLKSALPAAGYYSIYRGLKIVSRRIEGAR